MYRILIVDDEKIERNGIKFLLKRAGIECEIAEAANGKDALEYIKNNEIDILLTDVKMPFMDGIELIENVVGLKRNIKYVIFSGCSEFDYARQAVRLGVSDYILKPVDPNEFENTMNKVINELEESKIEYDIKTKSLEYMAEHMLYMATNKVDISEIEKYGDGIVSADFIGKYVRIMLMEFDEDFFGKKGTDVKEKLYKFEPQISKYLNLNQNQSLLFFDDADLDYVATAERISGFVEREYGVACYIAISSPVNGMNDIGNKVDELDEIMENKFYHKNSRVFYEGASAGDNSMIQVDDDTLMKQMHQDIKMKDTLNLRAHFDRFCDKYSNKTKFSQVYIKFLFSNLLKDFYENIPNADENLLNEEIDVLYRATNFDTVKEIVLNNVKSLEDAFGANPQMVHREIEIVKQYIYEHYNEDITVDSLAEKVYMAPSYLSSVFKKETGQNLSKFIKSYRMEQAKELLENTMLKIVDIANKCGYQNVSYFCSSFRDCYGVSPQKFRENGEETE